LSTETHKLGSVEQRLVDLDKKFLDARRERNEVESSYASGENTRMHPAPRGIDPMGADADTHYKSEHNYFLHVERGRAAVRNHPLVEQGLNRLVSNLRLDFQLDVDSGDTEFDAEVQADWKAWTCETSAGRNDCDYEGTRSFHQIARQSFFSRCSDGDLVHVPLVDGRLQTWESHHIRTPFGGRTGNNSDQNGMVHGAEIRNGRTTAYWITPHNVPFYGSLTKKGQARRFPVNDEAGNKTTFWLGFRHRFFQRRGISRLSAPRDAMTGFEDLNYANTKSSLRRALIAYLMEDSPTSSPTFPVGTGSKLPKTGARYTEHSQPDRSLGVTTAIIEQAGEPAQIIKAPDGKTLTGWNNSIPTQSFFEHASLMLTMLAVNLDLPLSLLLLDGSKTNFHGARFIWDQCKLRFTQIQSDEIQGLWAPTYEHRLRSKLNPSSPLYDRNWAAAVKRGADPFKYVFRARGWPYVKPAEDVAAEDKAESRNLQSQRSILAGRGLDIDTHIPEVVSDRASWIRYSLKTARNIATANKDLDLDIWSLSRELRYGQAATVEETVSLDQIQSGGDGNTPTSEAASSE